MYPEPYDTKQDNKATERCPNLIAKSAGDETYYFCDINDHPCLREYGDDICEEYEEIMKEWAREEFLEALSTSKST